jgi:hypothetical protein
MLPPHPVFLPSTEHGVPHISLVFREMWDTTDLNLFFDLREKHMKRCGREKNRMGHVPNPPKVPGRTPAFFPGWR